MIKGLYISALGMRTQMQRMDAISNNIANVNTTAFKRDVTVSRSFAEELTRKLTGPAMDKARPAYIVRSSPVGRWSPGLFVDDVYTDFSAGPLRRTDSALDLAIGGDGFFCVSAADENGGAREMYTRDGAFALAPDGTLVTADGYAVLGLNGTMTVPPGNITIDATGRVYSNGNYVDTLKMADFEDYHTLRKAGDNLWGTADGTVSAAFAGSVAQGFLEASNVNAVREMADMITASRAYEASSRLVTVHDTELGRAVSDIARK